MARRKKHSAPKEKNQNGEKVINELFGSLDAEDIEDDIAELGGNDPGEAPTLSEPVKKKRFFFVFAVFVIVMAIIGCISTVRFAADVTGKLLDNTSLKNEFAQFIFPMVVNDIAPFDSIDEIPNTSKITCAIWNILLTKDTTPYEDGLGGLLIPEYDVMASCKEIFGTAVVMEHQSVGTGEVRFSYDDENHLYWVQKNIRYLTYAPTIVEMDQVDGNYKLIVGYLPPSLATVSGISGMEVSPDKYRIYTINRWDGKNTLLSVEFCNDYEPATDD